MLFNNSVEAQTTLLAEAKTHLLNEYGDTFANLNELNFVFDTDNIIDLMAYDYADKRVIVSTKIFDKDVMVTSLAYISLLVKQELYLLPSEVDSLIKWNMACQMHILNCMKKIGEFKYPANSIVGMKSGVDMDQYKLPVEIYRVMVQDPTMEFITESGEVIQLELGYGSDE